MLHYKESLGGVPGGEGVPAVGGLGGRDPSLVQVYDPSLVQVYDPSMVQVYNLQQTGMGDC